MIGKAKPVSGKQPETVKRQVKATREMSEMLNRLPATTKKPVKR